jgi:hypothetical protein
MNIQYKKKKNNGKRTPQIKDKKVHCDILLILKAEKKQKKKHKSKQKIK